MYIGVRNWVQDYDGEYIPTNNGFTMPYTLHTTKGLYDSLTKILAKAEVLNDIIN